QFSDDSRIFVISRQELTDESYSERAREHLTEHVSERLDKAVLSRFQARLGYIQLAVTDSAGWQALAARLDNDDHIRAFYLANAPSLFGPIAEGIADAGLVTPKARIVLEKPVGHDYQSACEINDAVGARFDESQIYRIDHYLGKETVQNLIALRFGNSLFEPVWGRQEIDNVQ